MIRKNYAPITLALIISASVAQDLEWTAEECLLKDPKLVEFGHHDIHDHRGGGYVDDGEILLEGGWKTGMDVYAINYCVTD